MNPLDTARERLLVHEDTGDCTVAKVCQVCGAAVWLLVQRHLVTTIAADGCTCLLGPLIYIETD